MSSHVDVKFRAEAKTDNPCNKRRSHGKDCEIFNLRRRKSASSPSREIPRTAPRNIDTSCRPSLDDRPPLKSSSVHVLLPPGRDAPNTLPIVIPIPAAYPRPSTLPAMISPAAYIFADCLPLFIIMRACLFTRVPDSKVIPGRTGISVVRRCLDMPRPMGLRRRQPFGPTIIKNSVIESAGAHRGVKLLNSLFQRCGSISSLLPTRRYHRL